MACARVSSIIPLPETTGSPFRILDLPPEIVDCICNYLDGNNLINFRCVCKALTAYSSTAFGMRFFGHLVAILHPTSLATLAEIAHHGVFSKFVRKISISCQLLDNSADNSELHIWILTIVFQALQNVQVVRIDVGSFDIGLCVGNQQVGIRCGQVHMSSERSVDYSPCNVTAWEYSKVYAAVLNSLHRAKLRHKFCLELDIHDRMGSPMTPFDIASTYWISSFSMKLHKLQYTDPSGTEWLQQLLISAKDIRDLELHRLEDVSRLPFTNINIFHWHRLSFLSLDELFLHYREFIILLRQQSNTLEHLHFQDIGFLGGTWVEPLRIMRGMSQLKYLSLNFLLEEKAYLNSAMSSKYHEEQAATTSRHLFAFGREDIHTALDALHSHLQTEPLDMTRSITEGTAEATCFHQQVDLRKACAANERRITYTGGRWVRTLWITPTISSAEHESVLVEEEEGE